jgi:hypothetical protein
VPDNFGPSNAKLYRFDLLPGFVGIWWLISSIEIGCGLAQPTLITELVDSSLMTLYTCLRQCSSLWF